MISGIQTALKNAIDVIAPPATPLQDFTYHWKQLMNFYVNHINESKVLVETTNIPRHLDRLLDLLLIEEQELEEPGPCLEYLLQHRLLDLLASLASAETPPGMRLVCLTFFRKLLKKSKHSLLHHAAVYGPVQKLISLCNGNLASPIEDDEIQFLLCICFLVCKYPHITNIVNDFSTITKVENLNCDNEKSEIEKVTFVPSRKLNNANPLFKPLNTQAVTLVNPDLFKKSPSTNNDHTEICEPSQNTNNVMQSFSTQSTNSLKDIENVSQSSSPSLLNSVYNTRYTNSTITMTDNFDTLKLDTEYLPDIKSKYDEKQNILISNPSSPERSKCLLLESLKSYVNSADNRIRIRACEGIMVLASLDDELFADIVVKSDLASVVAKRLEFLFNLIPAHIDPSEIDDIEVTWGLDSPPLTNKNKFSGCRKVAGFLVWFDFCNQLTKEAHPDVADNVAKTIRIYFFEKILTPALSAHHAILITALIAKCLRDVSSSPLSKEMSIWFVGHQRHPDVQGVISWPVLHQLIENCLTESDDLTIETLKLFEEMIDKRDEHILHCLVLMYLNNRGYYDNNAADSAISSWSDEEDEREREKSSGLSQGMAYSRTLAPSNIHRIINCWFSLVPRQLQTESDDSYGRSVDVWEKQYSIVIKDCALFAWPLEAVTLDDGSCSRQSSDSTNIFYMGPFLTMLLDKVTNIPKQKHQVNLQLTILLSKLSLLPHPYLHEFLLNPLIPLIPRQKSLFICLQKVIKQFTSQIPKNGYKEILKETRTRLCSYETQNFQSSRSINEETLLESVIITEEFCKELAAIAYVKYHHSL